MRTSQLSDPGPQTRDLWTKNGAGWRFPGRLRRFLRKPLKEKYLTLALRAQRSFPNMPLPLRLGYGAWWLAENSALDEKLLHEGFEAAELKIVETLLRPGMTVVDAGAHHGFYTVLASKRVGRSGRVIAFEPSPRECTRLLRHIRLNRCKNVVVKSCALGEQDDETDLFIVEGREDWCNSLRPPAVNANIATQRVAVRRADDILLALRIGHVDFFKVDVEGAELSLLRGASRILRDWRPIILAEVQDVRTARWGYAAQEILEFLRGHSYRWFQITARGKLQPVPTDLVHYDANLMALPEERLHGFQALFA